MRGTTKLLCLIVAGALLAVSAPAEARISLNKRSTNELATNRISLNERTTNKLSANKLAANKLAANRLSNNRLAGNKLAANKLGANRISLNKRVTNSVHAAAVAPQFSAQRSTGDGAVTTISEIQFADGTWIQN